MFNTPYTNMFNHQLSLDRINEQINQLENMKKQIQQPVSQPTNLTQNFQLIPTNREVIKYANNIEEVQRDMVIGDTPYFSRDMSIVWVKNTQNQIRTYELSEIVPKDEKDLQIELLQAQINELKKGMNKDVSSDADVITTEIPKNTTRNDDTVRTAVEKNKPTNVQGISTGKKR